MSDNNPSDIGLTPYKGPPHPLDGHYLVYQVFTRDSMLHSELVPAREPLEFPSFDVPPYTTHAEVSITLYGVGGEHIAMVRRTYHPLAIKAALNSISWRILEDYLSVVMKPNVGV